MKSIADCHLYAFVDSAYLNSRDPEFIARELCKGGADIVQLRAKNARPKEILAMGARIAPILKEHGVPFVVNDRLDIAQSLNAEYCHLGQEDFFDAGHAHVSDLSIQSSELKIGLSTHAPSQAERAVRAQPAYIAIGPVYATGTKPSARPVTLDYVRWARDHVSIPWFAIGGVRLDNLDAVLSAGAARVCVVSAILNAPSVSDACRRFKERLVSTF